MKKIYLLSAMAIAAFISCQTIETEVPAREELQKVEMTFNASFDLGEELAAGTKTAVGEIDTENKLLKLTWKAGDKIAVFDDKSSGPNEFVANSDGSRVSFTGTVTAGATQFIAIYPYSAAKSVNVATGACEIDFPQDQHAVPGSFDPEALVTVGSATAENPSIRFRLLGSLLSFSVDFDDVVFVEFSGSRPMSGNVTFSNAVEATGPTSVATGTPNYKSVTLSNADGSPLKKGETYYVSVRHTGSNSQEGFTAKLITADAKVASRTGSSNLQIARKTLYPLGKFTSSNVTFAYDRYAIYTAGFDITIAGKTYNKAKDGDATLLGNEGIFKSSITGLVFLDAGATVTNTSEAAIESAVVIASNDPEHPATYKGTSGKSFLLKKGSLVFESVIIDMAEMTSGQFMTKKDNDQSFTSLTVQQCDIRNVKRPFFTPNSAYLEYGVTSITLNGNRIATGADVQLIPINSGATTLKGYKDFTFTNNVLYSSTGNAQQTYVFATSAAGIDPASCQQEVVMDNNLFYNIAASNGIFRSHTVKSVNIRNNILWAKDGSYSSNIKMFKANMFTGDAPATPDSFAGSSSDNYCFGNLGEKEWTISDSACRGPLTNVTTLDSNPIASFNTATGEFELVSAYKAFGPQIQPL
ncbi:MAG: DUF4957 domain-containing protein [Bacteroidales bacterium]|nr:DUF4957 domain-containing protein [Bacteroidales bacterium]